MSLKVLRKAAKAALKYPAVTSVMNAGNRFAAEVFASHRILATIYTFLSFMTFNREQFAVLCGRRDYYRHMKRRTRVFSGLRRNVHRLEKGMIMRPRRAIFAEDYIAETVDYFQRSAMLLDESEEGLDMAEIVWARDVLSAYFSQTGSSRVIDKARARFNAIPFKHPARGDKIPYPSRDRLLSRIAYDDFMTLCMQRRSVRWFLQKPVPRVLLDNALLAARQSPSACNRLPYEYLIFDEPALVRRVSSIPFGATGYADNIPVIIVLIGNLDHYFSPRDRHVIYIDTALSAMAFMLALETQGLSSSVINWPDFEPLEWKMQKTLGLKTSQRVIMLMAVGFPDPEGMVPFSGKKELDSIRVFNKPLSGRNA